MRKSTQLSRRTLLAGAGTLMALPALEAMLPNPRSARADDQNAPLRLIVFHFPIGVNRAAWKPSGTETNWSLGQSQEPLLPHKDDLCVITGVGTNMPSATAGHTCGVATFLSARDVPQGVTKMGTTADQMIAEHLSGQTGLKSLELGTMILNENPNGEPGYDPVLKDHLSWNNDTPLPKEIEPKKAFDRLFMGADPDASVEEVARRKHYRQSVLDAVSADGNRLQKRLGAGDNAKLDQYFTGIHELEKKIEATVAACDPGAGPSTGIPGDIQDHVQQMLDIMVLAAKCDATRVMTFSYQSTVTQITHPFLGVNYSYHLGVTHERPFGPEYGIVNKWLVSQLAYLLDEMKKVDEPGGTLLDNSIVYFSSEIAEGSSHSSQDLPIVVAGRGGGKIQPGRLLQRDGWGNGHVLISLMHAFGVNVQTFGNGFDKPLGGLLS